MLLFYYECGQFDIIFPLKILIISYDRQWNVNSIACGWVGSGAINTCTHVRLKRKIFAPHPM